MLLTQYATFVRNGCIAGLLLGSAGAQGSVLLSLELMAETGSSSVEYYLAFPALTDFNAGSPDSAISRQVIISSPDGAHSGYLNHEQGWGSSSSHIASAEALSDGLTGTWTLLDYAGTAEEREYRFEVDLGSVLSGGIPFTRVNSPVHGSLVSYENPTFTWSGPTDFESQYVTLYERNLDGSYAGLVASEFLGDAATEEWTPGVTLEEGGQYTFRVTKRRNVDFDGSIGTPLDAEGNAWEFGWSDAYATIQSGAQIDFTAVPEPTAVVGGVACLLWAGHRLLRARRAGH